MAGQPSRVLGAVGCMLMMAMMGGQRHGAGETEAHDGVSEVAGPGDGPAPRAPEVGSRRVCSAVLAAAH